MDWPPHVTTAQKTAVLKCHFKTAVDLSITFGYANMHLFKRRFFYMPSDRLFVSFSSIFYR